MSIVMHPIFAEKALTPGSDVYTAYEMMIPWGAWDDPSERYGEAHVLEHVLVEVIRQHLNFFEKMNSYGCTNAYRIRISWIMKKEQRKERLSMILRSIKECEPDEDIFLREKNKVLAEIQGMKKNETVRLIEKTEQIIYQRCEEEVSFQGNPETIKKLEYETFLRFMKEKVAQGRVLLAMSNNAEEEIWQGNMGMSESIDEREDVQETQAGESKEGSREDRFLLKMTANDKNMFVFAWNIQKIEDMEAAEIIDRFLSFRSKEENLHVRSVRERDEMLFFFICPSKTAFGPDLFDRQLFREVADYYAEEVDYQREDIRFQAERKGAIWLEEILHPEMGSQKREQALCHVLGYNTQERIWERFVEMVKGGSDD